MDFDKNKLMNNINTLIKENNLRIGEVEADVGISKGYLSRMSKEDNDTIPTVDLIWKLAQKLGTSVDMLVGGDFSKANDNLFFVMKFIYKLKKDTDLHNVEWKRVPKKYYENIVNGALTHPLFENDLPSCSKDGEPDIQTAHYKSSFTFENVSVFDDCFEGEIEYLGKIFIMELFYNSRDEGAVPFTEIVMLEYGDEDECRGDEIVPICSTLGRSQELMPSINELLTCIKRHEADVPLDQRQKSAISRYLNYGADDELPFN